MASVARRFGAAVIDLIALYVIHGLVVGFAMSREAAQPGGDIVPFLVAEFVLLLAYGALDLTGASIGKRALAMRVRSRSGEAASAPNLAARWLLKYLPICGSLTASLALVLIATRGGDAKALGATSTLSGLLFLLALIDLLVSLGSSRRALHDLLAGTAVVDVRP